MAALPLLADVSLLLVLAPLVSPPLVEALLLLPVDALPLPVVVLPVLVDALLFADALSLMQSVSAVPCSPAHADGVDALGGVDGAVAAPVVWAPTEPAAASAIAASRIRGLKKRFSCFMLPPAIVGNPVQ